ncbi:hypothetical protein [Mumia quercus]|uniref:hypothetical protein n=1 Tax=Mumia quercus TaxID=2976125 RepID=UPI0021CEB496|nr:hypothetical protein [Mumia quercus]
MRRSTGKVLVTGAAVALACSLAACGASQVAPARSVAQRFHQALATGDGAAACTLLSIRTRAELETSAQAPCEEAVLAEDVPEVLDRTAGVHVFGVMAQVTFDVPGDEPPETVFLSRYDEGWRVTSAGCVETTAATPYDCPVSGG